MMTDLREGRENGWTMVNLIYIDISAKTGSHLPGLVESVFLRWLLAPSGLLK
jgi:hypothetical protein